MKTATINIVPVSPAGGQGTFDAPKRITDLQTPEIVIALCGPMGTPLHEVAKAFKDLLQSHDFGYGSIEIVRLSAIIRELGSLPHDATTEQLIQAGNELRQKHGNTVLVQHAIKRIYLARQQQSTKADANQGTLFTPSETDAIVPAPAARVCHIIDSIKNVDELRVLRQVYGEMLHVVGVYTPIELRIERLLKKVKSPAEIHNLIDRDSGEEMSYGQSVQETFPQADFFLRADTGTDSQLMTRVRRFLELMMGVRIITPTVAERAMYEAFSAARNSACLSRQVGAAITDSGGDVLAVGWNDVPKAFGGLYESSDLRALPDDDHRCWNKDGGRCFNDEEKTLIATQVVGKLVDAKVIDEANRDQALQLIRHDSQLRNLIEFSRAVHAEMHALLNASRAYGTRVQGGKLFVTTYPCHSCARHMVAAGITEVYFLEPYRKSLATKLHADAITETESDTKKVRIMPFDGVAPSRFLRLFSAAAGGRKDAAGRMVTRPAHPVTADTMEAIETLEKLAIKGIESQNDSGDPP